MIVKSLLIDQVYVLDSQIVEALYAYYALREYPWFSHVILEYSLIYNTSQCGFFNNFCLDLSYDGIRLRHDD